ncbi:MAG: N-acetyltransferase family protein [Pseudomonadota bacterium]
MKIRDAKSSDIPAILTIWNEVIRESVATFEYVEKTHDDLERLLSARSAAGRLFLVAQDADAVIGFATYDQFRPSNGYARTMEHTVYVSPDAQGRGAARALMTSIEDHAAQRGAHVMMAIVSGENQQGEAFHARLGYKKVGVIPQLGFKWGRYFDFVAMQKILSPPGRAD